MKKKFSPHWKESRQTRKQRKYRANAPLHIRQKFVSANIIKELRGKYGRSMPVRNGDTVKIMRGKFSGKTGKVSKVDLKRGRISVEGMQIQKKDGTKVNVYFNPSKVQITQVNENKKIKEKENASEKK